MIVQSQEFQRSGNLGLESQQIRVKCAHNSLAVQFCLNQKCKQSNVFICFTPSCQCRISHKKCQKGTIASMVKNIMKKTQLDLDQFKQRIQSQFDKIINEISDIRDNLVMKIDSNKEKINLSYLSGIQKLFLNIIKNDENIESFTNQQRNKLLNFVNQEKKQMQSHLISQLKVELEQFYVKELDLVQKTKESLNKILGQIQQNQKRDLIAEVQSIKLSKKLGDVGKQFLSHSSILKTIEEVECLINFFMPQRVRKVKILFKASQNEFKLKKYWQKCGKQTHTLIICKTNADKIIGGYSPLHHSYEQGKQDVVGFVSDQTRRSFIYSLTNKDKFQLRNFKHSIRRRQNKKYIVFGNDELVICDQANKSNWSTSGVNFLDTAVAYRNQNYKTWCRPGSPQYKQTMLYFNGNEEQRFFTKEWEVWKIQFKK